MQSGVLSLDSSPRSGPWLLLSPSRYEIGRCARRFPPAVFLSANGSWLSVSLKLTTFNTPPQWVGMMRNYESVACRRQVWTVDGNPSIGNLYHYPSCTSHGHAIDYLATDHPSSNPQENERTVWIVLVVGLPSIVSAMLPVVAQVVGYALLG